MPAIAAADIEVAFVAWAVAEPDPVKVMIVLCLIGSDHCHFGAWIREVGIRTDRKPRDVGYTEVVKSVIVGRVANVEMTVGRVVRIKGHAENSDELALPDFEGDIEERCRVDGSGRKVDDLY